MRTASPLRYTAGTSGVSALSLLHVMFARVAAVVFLLNALYPITVKLIQERLAQDWLHSLLHLTCSAFGAYAGWMARSAGAARVFTWFIGAAYLGLALLGSFQPGLFLDTSFAIPLAPADNLFHLILGACAASAAAFGLSRAAGRRYR